MSQGHVPSKFCQIWFLLLGDFTYMGNAAQMVTVSEISIYRLVNRENRGFMCNDACLCLNFTYFGAKTNTS